jgi:hypothetical protein
LQGKIKIMQWEPIETAPKDGSRVCCWATGWEPCFLIWKQNHRIVDAHKHNQNLDLSEEYFGDPFEYDDYELAEPGNGPTHWVRLPTVPADIPTLDGTGK